MSYGCRIRQPWRAQYSCRVRMSSWKHVGLARAAEGFDTGLPRSSEGLVFPRLKAVFAVRQNRCDPHPGQAPWPAAWRGGVPSTQQRYDTILRGRGLRRPRILSHRARGRRRGLPAFAAENDRGLGDFRIFRNFRYRYPITGLEVSEVSEGRRQTPVRLVVGVSAVSASDT